MLKDAKVAKKDAKNIEQEMKISYFHVTSGAKKDTNGCQMHWGGFFFSNYYCYYLGNKGHQRMLEQDIYIYI